MSKPNYKPKRFPNWYCYAPLVLMAVVWLAFLSVGFCVCCLLYPFLNNSVWLMAAQLRYVLGIGGSSFWIVVGFWLITWGISSALVYLVVWALQTFKQALKE